MRYEGTVSPETMAAIIAGYRTAAETRTTEANRLESLPQREVQSAEWHTYARVLRNVADQLERAVQAERERITEGQ